VCSSDLTGGSGVTDRWLYVGTTPGGSDLLDKEEGNSLADTVASLPVDGRTLYVRLFSKIGSWLYIDYTYTATTVAVQKAEMQSPAPGSTLTASSVQFQWSGGVGVTDRWLYVGTTAGGSDLFNAEEGSNLSAAVAGLPTDGRPIYVRLYSRINSWQYIDYTYTAVTVATQKAAMQAPAPGSTLLPTVQFQWTGGSGVTDIWLYVGTTPGGTDLFNKEEGSSLADTVTGLPANGSTVYVRLFSKIGAWQYTDYTYTAVTAALAALTAPAASTTLSSSTVTFQWTSGTAVSDLWLYVGTTPGGSDLFNQEEHANLSATVSGLPTNGRPIYVRLFSRTNAWQYVDYVFTAAGAS